MRGLTKEKLRSIIKEEIEQMNEDPRDPDDFELESVEIGSTRGNVRKVLGSERREKAFFRCEGENRSGRPASFHLS